jgi:hypothetical protein
VALALLLEEMVALAAVVAMVQPILVELQLLGKEIMAEAVALVLVVLAQVVVVVVPQQRVALENHQELVMVEQELHRLLQAHL